MGDPKARRLTGRWEVFAEHVERWGVHSAVRSRIAWRLDESLGLHLFGVYKRPLSRRPADSSTSTSALSIYCLHWPVRKMESAAKSSIS